MKRLGARIAIIALVVIPLGSRLFGDGLIGYTMYSSTSEFRLDVVVTERNGATHPIAPTGLAEGARPHLASAHAGAESFHRTQSAPLRNHLREVGVRVCETRDVATVALDLHERDARGERVTHVEVTCER
jgi:hypothetical protein